MCACALHTDHIFGTRIFVARRSSGTLISGLDAGNAANTGRTLGAFPNSAERKPDPGFYC
jgi:hypothetical protein